MKDNGKLVVISGFSGSGKGTENAKLKNELQLIGDGHARHLFCPDLTDHDIVQKTDKIGDALLNDDRQHHLQNPPVKISGSDVFLQDSRSVSY